VILNISMPEMNGFDAARMIRSIHPHSAIVILSSHKNRQFEAEARRIGAPQKATQQLNLSTPLRMLKSKRDSSLRNKTRSLRVPSVVFWPQKHINHHRARIRGMMPWVVTRSPVCPASVAADIAASTTVRSDVLPKREASLFGKDARLIGSPVKSSIFFLG
jgi:CheY-like chemotaxis protein